MNKKSVWGDLSKEKKNLWSKFAEKNQSYLQLFKLIMENDTCFMCKFKNPKRADALSFHLQSTHGFTLHEIITEYLNNARRNKKEV